MVKPNLILSENRIKKIEYLNSLEYDILLKQKKGKFYLYIPEISLVAASDDLNQAYQDLFQQKQTFFNKILDCEAENEVTLPRKTRQAQETFYQLKMFACKLLIICFLGGTTLVFGGVAIRDKLASFSGTDIVKKISRGVVLEAKEFTNTPEYHKQIRIKKLREFLAAFRPWIDEFRVIFSSPSHEGKEETD